MSNSQDGNDGEPGPASDILLTASNAMIQSGIAKNKEEEEEDGENIGGGVQPLENLQEEMGGLLPKEEEEENNQEEEEESQKVHEPQYYPNNRLDRQSKSSRAPRRSPTSRSNAAKNNNQVKETTAEDPEGLAKEFEDGATVSNADSQTLAKTVVELESRRDNQQSGSSMKDTLRISMAIEKAKAAQRESCKRETQKQALKENQEKQEKVKEDLRRMQKAMKEKEKTINQKNNDYIESIQAKHDKQRSDLDKKWKNDITVQRRYNRSSQQLRTLRLTQERLMRAKKFSESESIAQIADRLEQDEINRNFDTMNKDYLLAVKSLEDRQREEMQLAEEVMKRRLEEHQALFESQKRPYMRRLSNLKKEEEEIMASPDNVWNLRHRNDGDLVSSIVGPRSTKAQQHSLVARDNKYNTIQLPKLDINTGASSAASNYRSKEQSQVSNRQSQSGVSAHVNEEEDAQNNEEEGEHEAGDNEENNEEEEEKEEE
ncbi:hypothetical protein M9Y10_023157 [Tritrichomonas musculus]|uniref:Uncharacterized protein n=1 Tax=Tritrichomonas musculus TaxID=1915356 RepID=A0ABR2KUE1_9EUKA